MASRGLLGALRLKLLGTPATPASGELLVYPKADGLLYTLDALGVERVIGGVSGDTNPVGTIIIHGAPDSSKFPTNYVWCNGQSLSAPIANGGTVDTYANLFSVIGYQFGGSGGSFNVPDTQRRWLMGADGPSGSLRPPGSNEGGTLGQREGAMYHSHSHTHDHTHSMPHNHDIPAAILSSGKNAASGTATGLLTTVASFDGHNHSSPTGGSNTTGTAFPSTNLTSTVGSGTANTGGVPTNGAHAFMSFFVLMKY